MEAEEQALEVEVDSVVVSEEAENGGTKHKNNKIEVLKLDIR